MSNPQEMFTVLTDPSGISVASYNVGCFFGAIATIWLGNILGRRKAIFLGSSIMVIGAVLQSAAFGLPQFIVGRLITGYARYVLATHGMLSSLVPIQSVYSIAACSTKAFRQLGERNQYLYSTYLAI